MKGMSGMRSMITLFKKFDVNGDNRLDRHEIQWLLKQNGHFLSQAEFEQLFRYFDKNNDGVLSLSEFIHGIRGELSEARAGCVKEAWQRMCYDQEMSVEEFKKFYQEQNVSESFAAMMKDMDFNTDGKIQFAEFCDYYTNVSHTFNEDFAFKEFIYSSWGLN